MSGRGKGGRGLGKSKAKVKRSTSPHLQSVPVNANRKNPKDEAKIKELKAALTDTSRSDLKEHLTTLGLSTTGLKKAFELRLFNFLDENDCYDLSQIDTLGKKTNNNKQSKTQSKGNADGNKKYAPKKIEDSESEDEDEGENDEEDEEEEEIIWQWADDSATGSQDLWRDYSSDLQKKLNSAHAQNQAKVRIDTQRYVDLSQSPYLQRRYDDPTRRRLVQRFVKKTKKSSSKMDIDSEPKEEIKATVTKKAGKLVISSKSHQKRLMKK